MSIGDRTPKWVYALMLVLASLPPASHFWIANYPPSDVVPTGLSNSDSAIYLQAMRMLANGFYSPYATCKALGGPNDIAYLPMPFHWLYALMGAVADWVQADDFLFLGMMNGVFGAVYLLVVYRFLKVAAPRQADLAFLLFALGGGLGGLLYAVTGVFHLHGNDAFETYFWRAAMYELVEGPYLSPILHMPRLYYTLALSLCLGGLTALIRAIKTQCNRHLGFASLLLCLGAIAHVRLGGFAWAIAMIYLLGGAQALGKERLRAAVCVTLAVAGAFGLFAAISLAHPVFMRNTGVLVRESMWVTGFISVAAFHLVLVPKVIASRIRRLPRALFVTSWAAMGYLAAFSVLFIAYQIYFGNLLGAGDAAAATAISDWALLGLVAGGIFGATRRHASPREFHEQAWVVPWLLVFTAIAISAWGQGWFLRLTPQRLMLFLGIPLSILSATALQAWARRRPRRARSYLAAMIACGLVSAAVGTLYFQGPLGRAPGEGPFARLHPEIMTPADADLLQLLRPGIVLAPASFSDVIALRPGMRVLGGVGGTDLSDQMSTEIDPAVARFFSAVSSMDRSAFLDEWCIDFVYCPDTWPVNAKVLEELRSDARLEVVAERSRGILLRVSP
ncbi:MAG: hypothetical protein IID09_07900 [Candidatus Hydrogenedentes bacterium]|nr:hypothetical protein [Candidatus Hydrogenedentota bacterium]